MKGYLLDTNHVAALFQKKPSVMKEVAALPAGTQLRACTVTPGEIAAGHQMTKTTNQARRDSYTAFINKEFLPNALPISTSTGLYYAQIVSSIWRQHPPANPRTKTEVHLVRLGVDINDVWAVAVAMEHGLVFVTEDRMTCIKQAVPGLLTVSWM